MMNSKRIFASLAVLSAAAVGSPTLFLVNSQASYLLASGETPANALAVDLNANGFFAGQTVIISRAGAFNHGGTSPYRYGMSALFSSSNVILPSTLLNRVPGAIDAGPDWTSPNTFNGNMPTDIAEDFQVDNLAGTANGITLTIPTGALYLIAAAQDNYFSNNNNAPEFYVSIRPVPEPLSIAALGLGLGLFARRRLKSR